MVADWPSESTSELVTAGKGREGSASASEQAPSTPAIEASEQEFTIGVSKTAQWVGYFRVLEAERDNPLFVDFLAKTLVGGDQARHVWNRMIDSVGMPRFIMSRERYSRMEHNHFVVRHRYMDDFALRYLAEHVRLAEKAGAYPKQLQVVNLACGLDSRAFRLNFPRDTVMWEIDRQEVLSFKDGQIAAMVPRPQPKCKRVTVPACLLGDDWEALIVKQGFDPALPTVWLAEGLLMYLSHEQIGQLIGRIKAMSAPGSAIVADMVNLAFMTCPFQRRRQRALHSDGCAFRSYSIRPVAMLTRHGVREARFLFQGDDECSYGRVLASPLFPIFRLELRFLLLAGLAAALMWGAKLDTAVAVALAAVGTEIVAASGLLEKVVRAMVMLFQPLSYVMEGRIEREREA